MKKRERVQTLAMMVVLALLVAACGAVATPPPSTPPPTQAQASEALVSAEEDLLGTWQVEGTAGDPVLVNFFEGRFFSVFAGDKGLDRGYFVVKEKQLTFSTVLKTCRFCKGSYQVYVAQQDGQPVQLRFVLSGQDPNAARASALNGKTVELVPGALPGEESVSTVEDVTGIWLVESDPEPIWLACDNGRYRFHFQTEVPDSGTLVVQDGKLVLNTTATDIEDASYTVFVTRQSGQPVWLRFIPAGDTDSAREQILTGNIARLQLALQPGETPLGALDEVIGTWITQTSDAPARVLFDNGGRFQIQIGGDFADRGSIDVGSGRLTFHSEMPNDRASGSYLIYVKKQAGQVAQLRFSLIREENEDRSTYFDQQAYQPGK